MLHACSNETETLNIPDNYEYFPLQVGKYWVYEVDSVVVFEDRLDSSKTYLKEQITDYFIDNVGDTIYRADQYERKDTAQPWQIKRVVSLSRNQQLAVRTENNIPLVKLTFPLYTGVRWNGAVLIDPYQEQLIGGESVAPFKYWDFKVVSVDEPYSIGNTHFPETVTVIAQKDTKIENRSGEEIYAKKIGLIQRQWEIFDCNSNLKDCTNITEWKAKATSGMMIRQRLLQHN